MLTPSLLPQAATWLRPGSDTDAYGNAVPDWAAATSTVIACRLEQATRSETDDESRDALVATWRLWTNETGLSGRDRVVVDGATYEVDGPPALVMGGSALHHVEATLRRVDG